MKKQVSNLLNEIINEASQGTVFVENWKFFVRFYTKINGKMNVNDNGEYPVVEIKNYDLLVDRLVSYLSLAEKFYSENQEYYDLYGESFYKRLLLDLFNNASLKDFNNFEGYVLNRTNMLENESIEREKFKLGNYLDYEIYGVINKNRSYYESLYNMDIYFKNGKDSFYLPSLNFSLLGDTCYLYSVQRKKEIEKNDLSKKLDRYFRKVNKNVDDEMLSNVSPNALVSLTIFNAFLKSHNIKKIISDTYMPIRYYGNRDKLSHKKNIDIDDAYKRLELDQYNMTNKFMYLLLRYDHHFDCGCQYDDINEKMVLNLENTITNGDNIIYNIDQEVSEYNSKRREISGRVSKNI